MRTMHVPALMRPLTAAAVLLAAAAPAPALAAAGANPSAPATTATAPAATTPATAITTATTPTTPAATTPVATTTLPAATTPAATTPSGAAVVVKTTTQGRPKSSSGPSRAAIAAAVIAGVIALCALIWGIAHMEAYEPHWVLTARHGIAEAGLRASATFAELLDWARLGR